MKHMPESFTEHFAALDQLLLDHQSLWDNQPFTQQRLAWEADYPELSAWLRAQSLEHAERHQFEPWKALEEAPLRAPGESGAYFLREIQKMRLTLLAQTGLPRHPVKQLPGVMSRGIPGRKWQQIEAFAACLPPHWQGSRWLDWCAGKGHLGRRLAWPADSLCCLEHDPALVEAGKQLSRQWHVKASHPQCDALGEQAIAHLAASDTWVALHACGDLHTSLLRHSKQQGVQRLAIAPCCYNRIRTRHYQPLSGLGQASALQLDRHMLGLPLQATVTAGAAEIRRLNRNMAWRLGFDLLQRQWRQVDAYLPVPSAANRWRHESFAHWCQAAARLKGIQPGPVNDWQAAEQAGWQRLAEVRNLELVQGLFRRPLELWLLLDMALFLQEQGFAVQLGEFCPWQLTPRNLLLVAERQGEIQEKCT